MILHSVALEWFRNYEGITVEFAPGVNVIYGENAQGKTNLLEGIGYLSTASSHRARYDRELIQFGRDHAFLKGALSARGREFVLEARLHRGGRRQLFSNGVRLKRAAELSGVLTTVLFCPEDLYLIRAGAAERRKFLGGSISQLRTRYGEAFAVFLRLYEHKTRILRDYGEKPDLLDTLEEFNVQMARAGAVLIHYRAHFVKRLREVTPVIHREFSGGREVLELRYETVKNIPDPEASPRELLPLLLEHQNSHRRAELETRQCLSGPHKDDLEVLIDGVSAKTFASQGQTRTAALSLKLASREIIQQDTGEWPVLLLDDVLSELDAKRQEFVLRRITGGQVFITCCGDMGISALEGGRTFRIQEGKIVS